MPPSRYFEAGAPVKQVTIQQSITGTVRPTISLALLEILPIGRTRANCWGCITCAFCDLSANRQPILNFLTDLRGAHAASVQFEREKTSTVLAHRRGRGRPPPRLPLEHRDALSGRGFALSRGHGVNVARSDLPRAPGQQIKRTGGKTADEESPWRIRRVHRSCSLSARQAKCSHGGQLLS
jgi:hypothetical protein